MQLQVKYAMKEDTCKVFFAKSDQPNPTLYISQLPKYAEQIKSQGKGVIYIGHNFVVALLASKDLGVNFEQLEEACKAMSSKTVKLQLKKEVKYDYKEKGKKPVVTKEVVSMTLTGDNFQIDELAELVKKMTNGLELD